MGAGLVMKYWGEPEWAPHSHVLKMSLCAFVCFWPLWYGGSFCVVEHRAVMWRSWVWASQRQLSFFFFFFFGVVERCSRVLCCYVKVVSLSLTKTTSCFFGEKFSFFWCGRASCCNVKVVTWASQRQYCHYVHHFIRQALQCPAFS